MTAKPKPHKCCHVEPVVTHNTVRLSSFQRGFLADRLRTNLLEGSRLSVRVDQSQFILDYEASVLSLDELTSHQEQKLRECEDAGGAQLHIMAPAGAGKTHVAMYKVINLLNADPKAHVLFAARNVALCYYVVRLLCNRVQHPLRRLHLLRRLHVLFEPFEEGAHRVTLKNGTIFMAPMRASNMDYQLVVIDEAHHIYNDSKMRLSVESHVHSNSQRLLVSDVSQATATSIIYPEGLTVVHLTEVVRCSKRIVSAASSFQLGGSAKLKTQCHHESEGPPLKTYLFDVADSSTRYSNYVIQLVNAMEDLIKTFPDLPLQGRLAILMPDGDFLAHLKPLVVDAFRRRFKSRAFTLIDAVEAHTMVWRCSTDQSTTSAGISEPLIFDTVENFDGCERLIVIAVGLDVVIGPRHKSGDDFALQARSHLYRALTRAHMFAVVINEALQGSWLEHLTKVRLQRDETAEAVKFDDDAELERRVNDAAENVVRDLTKRIEKVLSKCNANQSICKPHMQMLLKRIEAKTDAMVAEEELEATVKVEQELLDSDNAELSEAAKFLNLDLTSDQKIHFLEKINQAKHSSADGSSTSAQAVLQDWVEVQNQLRREQVIQKIVEKNEANLAPREQARLAKQVASSELLDADDMEMEVVRAATEWRKKKMEVGEAVKLCAERRCGSLLPGTLKALTDACVESICRGEGVETAVEDVIGEHMLETLVRDVLLRAIEKQQLEVGVHDKDMLLSEAFANVSTSSSDKDVQESIEALLTRKVVADRRDASLRALNELMAQQHMEVVPKVQDALNRLVLEQVTNIEDVDVQAVLAHYHNVVYRAQEALGLGVQPAGLLEDVVAAVLGGDELDITIFNLMQQREAEVMVDQTVWDTSQNSSNLWTSTEPLAFNPYPMTRGQQKNLFEEFEDRLGAVLGGRELHFHGANDPTLRSIEDSWSLEYYDDAAKREENHQILDAIAGLLRQFQMTCMDVHAETGPADYAAERLAAFYKMRRDKDVQPLMDHLARNRASSCVDALVDRGIDARRLTATYRGGRSTPKVQFRLNRFKEAILDSATVGEKRDDAFESFRRADADGSGSIDVNELHGALQELGLAADMSQTQAVMQRYDTDRSGTLELSEYRRLVDELRQFKGRK